MLKNGLIYLASPYSHPDKSVMEKRYLEALKAVSYLMNQGYIVFSPIVHNHPVAVAYGLPRGWDYWEKYDSIILRVSSELLIYTLEGWQNSRGIKGELALAHKLLLSLDYLSPEEVNGGI